MKRPVQIGILRSRSGGYQAIARASLTGAQAGIDRVNADPALSVRLIPVERDPAGQIDHYAPLCQDILATSAARHILGCVTSSSRKEVLPVLERAGATLWYPLPYEGFEASEHVAYLHACPNQHLLPLLGWALPRFGRRVHLVGSNYIWGWEINRLAREVVTTAGGEILRERHLAVGETDVARIVDEIEARPPHFVLNSLIGPSQYNFVREMRRRGLRTPILSCNLTEGELPLMGRAAEGLIAAGPFFRTPGAVPDFGSSHEAVAFDAVMEMARLFHRHPGAEAMPLAQLLDLDAGASMIDRRTHHRALPVLIARVENGTFRVIHDLPAVAGDPYLTRSDPVAAARPALRVVG